MSNTYGVVTSTEASLVVSPVVAWGDDSSGQTDVPFGLTNVVAIAAGAWHSLALKTDGTVVAWGANWFGVTNIPSGLTNVVAIASGAWHGLALQEPMSGRPFILAQPVDQGAYTGAAVRFRVVVRGAQPISYQWRLNGTNLPGATNSVLVLSDLRTSQSGSYAVTAANSYGSVSSRSATLFVDEAQPLALAIRQLESTIELSWPASATNYLLESAALLGDQAKWIEVTSPPLVVSGDRTILNVEPTESAQYYRLRQK